jgi:hypothetical protein
MELPSRLCDDCYVAVTVLIVDETHDFGRLGAQDPNFARARAELHARRERSELRARARAELRGWPELTRGRPFVGGHSHCS